MTSAELRRQAKRNLDKLSDARLQAAADIIAFLQARDSDDATVEVLQIPGVMDEIKKAEKDAAAGRAVNWRKVRRDV